MRRRIISFMKPTRAARAAAKHDRDVSRRLALETAKRQVRQRDRTCRFPLCGCRRIGLSPKASPEVSHERHQGMGGNPAGDRNTPANLVFLCRHRHQDGAISRHRGTLRAHFHTDAGFDGPIAWEASRAALKILGLSPVGTRPWYELASEQRPGVIGPLTADQAFILASLARMED